MVGGNSTHSRIGASSMHRWSRCPGSVRLSEGLENRSSRYAEEGTAAHTLAEQCLRNGYTADRFVGKWIYPHDELFGRWLFDGPADGRYEITDEMAEAVDVYLETVRDDYKPGMDLLIEHRFNLDNVHKGLFGTSDAVLYDPETKLLRVYDYKHGAGLAVEVKGNLQLQYYGLGALLSTGHPCKEVELVIVQPRCPHPDGPVRRWRIPSVELLDFAGELAILASATQDSNAPLNPGEWCRFCPAAGICPAVREKAQEVARREFRSDLSYDPEQLADTLRWLPVLKAWAENVNEFAYGEAMHGRTPPGFKLVEKRATRKWTDEEKAARALGDRWHLRGDDIYERKLLSPAKIEKLIPKEERERLKDLVTAESSGYALVPEDDKRPPVKMDAKAEFGAVT